MFDNHVIVWTVGDVVGIGLFVVIVAAAGIAVAVSAIRGKWRRWRGRR